VERILHSQSFTRSDIVEFLRTGKSRSSPSALTTFFFRIAEGAHRSDAVLFPSNRQDQERRPLSSPSFPPDSLHLDMSLFAGQENHNLDSLDI
jgi:hypothetical protein